MQLNDRGYFEARGLNVLVFSNPYSELFGDAKIGGIELIQREVRTATNGDVRLGPTPGQWDPIPQPGARKADAADQSVEVSAAYPGRDFAYTIRVQAAGEGVTIRVILDRPLPAALEGRAGLNLEFLPAAYFHHAYLADGRGGTFPLHPGGPMAGHPGGPVEPLPLATARTLVLAPEDPARRVTIHSADADLALFDGRNVAANGWFVVRTLLPARRTGAVVTWSVAAAPAPDWIRTPVIGHSQLGYIPGQRKVAVLELDANDHARPPVRLLQIAADGSGTERLAGPPQPWGRFLRYDYATFDFSAVTAPGLYVLAYGGVRTRPFRIAPDLYAGAWQPTLDVYLPVAMDHMSVREAYRVWHGWSHRDDARQAPVNHVHFDLYAQGPTTDTPFQPGEHIPGLAVGGWFDAGDFDIRTQTQTAVVRDLVAAWEEFGIRRDETTVDQVRHHVELHAPDGVPDLLQQIEHGTLALIAQFRAVGHAINGIIEPDLAQYTHLGDAASKTDGLIYDSRLKPGESDGRCSGTPDDRWAFTTKSTPLNYDAIAALAAASRALRGYRDGLADECLATAERVWAEEHTHAPDRFHHFNTTGGELAEEEFKAAVELLVTTRQACYGERVEALWPAAEKNFAVTAPLAVRALPFLGAPFRNRVRAAAQRYAAGIAELSRQNPYGVPVWTGGWAGNGFVIEFAITNYALHRAFPDLVDREAVFRGLNYLHGCHPGSDTSFVSGVGTVSKEVAYGNNRADFSFIAGGVVPGVLIVQPDFPENQEDWPFLWAENEYVVNHGAAYIYLANAADRLAQP